MGILPSAWRNTLAICPHLTDEELEMRYLRD